MKIVSILLVTLLIAMFRQKCDDSNRTVGKYFFFLFSNVFDRLQTDTDRIWKFQRYSLVCEYLSRPSLPPPFILFAHLWQASIYVLSRCCKCQCFQTQSRHHILQTTYRYVGYFVRTRVSRFFLAFQEKPSVVKSSIPSKPMKMQQVMRYITII